MKVGELFASPCDLLIQLNFELNQIDSNFGHLGGDMSSSFRVHKPFEKRPPRLKDLISSHIMGDVWVRDSPFGAVTDSLVLAEKFSMKHHNILRAIAKCRRELGEKSHYRLEENLIEAIRLVGAEGRKRKERKVDITEFGLALLLLYINSPKARQISADILFRFFILKTYVQGLNERQIGALRGYYRSHMRER